MTDSPKQILPFKDLVKAARDSSRAPKCLISFDPGKTTGVAVFRGTKLVHYEQLITPNITLVPGIVQPLFDKYKPTAVVVEDYRVFSWKAQQHIWSDLLTPRLIGALEVLCAVNDIPLTKQSPQVAKQFCNDDKLKGWGFWIKGQRHTRDAIRHGCYYILFNKKGIHK